MSKISPVVAASALFLVPNLSLASEEVNPPILPDEHVTVTPYNGIHPMISDPDGWQSRGKYSGNTDPIYLAQQVLIGFRAEGIFK